MQKIIDLRSDTVTRPTEAMRHAMSQAEVGDDVYGEDPTVRELEEFAAHILGKESALFVTSGTQGNLVALATHARVGDEVVAEAESHIFYYESAGVSAVAGAQIRQIKGEQGILQPEQVEKSVREQPNDHHPRTAVISLENTHNRAGGTVYPLETLKAIADVAKRHEVKVHMDGARLFNAAVNLNVKPNEITQYVDSVQICLSKGLCAPVGSIVAGDEAFIREVRRWRKRLGGGMRQVGVIAAPGLIALRDMVSRLADDHKNARYLAEHLSSIPGVRVDLDTVQTNIVICDIGGLQVEVPQFLAQLKEHGVLATSFGGTLVRFVTHHDVTDTDIQTAIQAILRVTTQK